MGSQTQDQQPCVLLCVTGCIAAYKSCEILRLLQKAGMRVKVCMTEHACEFVGPPTFRALTHEKVAVGLFDDPEDPIHHISLAQEADLVLVAPATANIIAKMAHGIADDLMSTTLLATRAPILVAPAMNTGMWEAAATQDNIATLRSRGCRFIMPASGRLACGDIGSGKLAAVEGIAEAARSLLASSHVLEGKRVLITAGGTQEAIDPVRYIGNRSSGKFGYALARAARDAGADVALISAPTELSAPVGVDIVSVTSARDMFLAVDRAFDDADVFVSAAAVADFTPVLAADQKIKKAQGGLSRIDLVENPDILATMCARKGERVVIGFAAETQDLLNNATTKLKRKGCDALIANDVSQKESTFGSDTNRVLWIRPDFAEELPLMSKDDLSHVLIRKIAEIIPLDR